MPTMFEKMKAAVTGQEPEPETLPQQLLRQVDEATSLTWKQRAIGFGICFSLGILLSFVSITFLWTFQLTAFAVMYTFGNICSICSTMFLMGPCRQCKKMMEEGRIYATAVYLIAIIITLVVAFQTGNVILVIICLIVQFLAMVWYCLTWIPGGMAFAKRMVGMS